MHVKNQAAEQQLLEEFKQINWWARNEWVEVLILLLLVIAFWVTIYLKEASKFDLELANMTVVVVLGGGYLFICSIVLRHFFGEVPWQKYKKLHMPPEQEDEDDLSMSG